MRIVGGHLKGRRLAGPKSNSVRPTSDRTRESLFNILGHSYGMPKPSSRILDLFAGTGALALEALSRGASFALLVENGPEARGLIRENIEALGLAGRARLFRRDATHLGPIRNMSSFDLVFCDPPYGKGLGQTALEAARSDGWLANDALCVLEESLEAEITLSDGFEVLETRISGQTQIVLASPK